MADAEAYVIPIQADGSQAERAAGQIDALATAIDSTRSIADGMASSVASNSVAMASLAASSSEAGAAAGSAAEAISSMGGATSSVDSGGIDSVASAAKEAASASDKATTDVEQLSDALDEVSTAADKASGEFKGLDQAAGGLDIKAGELSGAFGALGGPLGKTGQMGFGVVDAFQKIGASAGPMGAAVIGAVVAFTALAAAGVAATIALAKFAVESNEKAMKSLGDATKKAKEGFASIFKDVRVDGFVHAYEQVLTIFDEGSAEANGMKALVETLLNPLFDAAAAVGPLVKEVFRGMIWAALEAAIVVVKLRNAIMAAIPAEVRAEIKELSASIDWVKIAFYGGAVAAAVIVVTFTALAAIVGVLAVVIGAVLFTAVMIVLAPFILVAVAVAAVIAILYGLYVAVTAAIEYLGGLAEAGVAAASGMIDGIVAGIQSGTGQFVSAIQAMAQAGIGALKSALGIASPSKVFAEFGLNTTAGMAEGVDEGTEDVQSSLAAMASPEDLATAGGTRAGGAVASGGNTYYVTVQAPSGEAPAIVAAFERWFESRLHATAAQLGGGEVPA